MDRSQGNVEIKLKYVAAAMAALKTYGKSTYAKWLRFLNRG